MAHFITSPAPHVHSGDSEGVIPKAKALPPAAVKYICQSFEIDVE